MSSENKRNYTSIVEFRKLLNDVESRVQEKIRSISGTGISTIGVSIQLLEEEQDDNTPTRGQKADINGYCKSIQDKMCERCDKFDVQAKQFLNSKKKNKKTILFNCHANVTNFLIPFVPRKEGYNYNGPIFYVFFGHFLLGEENIMHSSYSKGIHVFNKSRDLIHEEVNDYDLINDFRRMEPSAFRNPVGYEDSKPIAISTGLQYIGIEESGLQLIEEELFENGILVIDEITKEINTSVKLDNYINRVEPSIIQHKLQIISQSVTKSKALEKKGKESSLKSIERLTEKIRVAENKIQDLIEDQLKINGFQNSQGAVDKSQLFSFLTSDLGTPLLKGIDEIYDNFSLVEIQNFVYHFAGKGFGNSLWSRTFSKIDTILKENEDFPGFKFIESSSGIAFSGKVTSFLASLNSKLFEYSGVLLFAVAGNFLFHILSPDEIVSIFHVLYFSIFSISGFLILYFANNLHLLNKDYYLDSSIEADRRSYIYQRIGKKYKFYLYAPIILILVSFIFTVNTKRVKEYHAIANALDIETIDPYPNKSIKAYNQFGFEQGLFDKQVDFLTSLVIEDYFNQDILVVDALCINDKPLRSIQTKFNNCSNVIGCFPENMSTGGMILDRESSDIIIDSRIGEFDKEFSRNSIDIFYLLNNSLPELKSPEQLDSVFADFYHLLKKEGTLIVDFDNNDYSLPVIAPSTGIGVKRIRKDNDYNDTYTISFRGVDVTKNPSIDTLISNQRIHSNVLSDKNYLMTHLKMVGFSNVSSKKIGGYPFEILLAKK